MLKKKLIIISLSLLIASFFFGVTVGVYKIPPYNILNFAFDKLKGETIAQTSNDVYVENDPAALIEIHSDKDILEKRIKLINYIFKDNTIFYDAIPEKIEQNIQDERYKSS